MLNRSILEGVAGASVFRADAALVVTWYNTAAGIAGNDELAMGQLSTYQAIWLTDKVPFEYNLIYMLFRTILEIHPNF